jgi:hypothetical protein
MSQVRARAAVAALKSLEDAVAARDARRRVKRHRQRVPSWLRRAKAAAARAAVRVAAQEVKACADRQVLNVALCRCVVGVSKKRCVRNAIMCTDLVTSPRQSYSYVYTLVLVNVMRTQSASQMAAEAEELT